MLAHYMLSAGTHPFHATSHTDVEQNIVTNKSNLCVDDRVALHLVQTMLTHNPDDRPSSEELLR